MRFLFSQQTNCTSLNFTIVQHRLKEVRAVGWYYMLCKDFCQAQIAGMEMASTKLLQQVSWKCNVHCVRCVLLSRQVCLCLPTWVRWILPEFWTCITIPLHFPMSQGVLFLFCFFPQISSAMDYSIIMHVWIQNKYTWKCSTAQTNIQSTMTDRSTCGYWLLVHLWLVQVKTCFTAVCQNIRLCVNETETSQLGLTKTKK